MSVQELLLALIRGLHLAMLLSLFGTLTFTVLLWPSLRAVGSVDRLSVPLTRLKRVSAAGAFLFGFAWFVAETAKIAGTTGFLDLLRAIPTVAEYSRYGHVMTLRLVLVLALVPLAALPRAGPWLALIFCGAALGLQGLIGHAGAEEGSAAFGLILSEALHLMAAGAWLGSLPPLLLCLGTLPTPMVRIACERFSPIGLAAVLVIAATALVQAIALIGGLPQLLGTSYGLAALAKLALFVTMMVLAVWNRLSLTDRLLSANPRSARRHLLASVTTETGLGLLVVLTAGLLASLPPAEHEAPYWPFPWRPSLAAMADPDLRREVALALLAVGFGVAAIALSWVLRRGRVIALLLALPLIAWRAPSLGLLLVEAYPTSFLTSTTGFSASSIANGQVLFTANCAACHGATGQGNGPAAKLLPIKPADLTAEHLWAHSDGELFWWISHGIDDPEGGLAMPAFGTALSDRDRWSLIDFVRALNSGNSMRVRHDWTQPIPAPAMAIDCAGATADQLAELRGKVIRIVASDDEAPEAIPPSSDPDVIVVRLDRVSGAPPPDGGCVSATSAAWPAYAAVAGVSPDALAGTEFLVDTQGWLRALRHQKEQPSWSDPAALKAAVQAIRAQPITLGPGNTPFGGIHVHGH